VVGRVQKTGTPGGGQRLNRCDASEEALLVHSGTGTPSGGVLRYDSPALGVEKRSAVVAVSKSAALVVQTGGESFVRRVVELGSTYADRVGVLAGIATGERVVVRGGYHVKLAATTTEIGHGHAH